MKNFLRISLTIATITILGCGQQENSPANKVDEVISKHCLIAVYERDTATMEISYLKHLKVKGKLKINYANHAKNSGVFDGSFSGDTLFVNYRFFTANESTGSFTNPLAFLKNAESLTMGVAQIETTLGRSYFVKGKKINFERSKFVFEKVDCK